MIELKKLIDNYSITSQEYNKEGLWGIKKLNI